MLDGQFMIILNNEATIDTTVNKIYSMMMAHSLCKKMGTSGADPPFFFLDDIIIPIDDLIFYILTAASI